MGVITSVTSCWVLEHILCENGACGRINHFTPFIAHGLLLSIVIITRFLNNQTVFTSGTVRIESVARTKKDG